jgi:hypothetical protein
VEGAATRVLYLVVPLRSDNPRGVVALDRPFRYGGGCRPRGWWWGCFFVAFILVRLVVATAPPPTADTPYEDNESDEGKRNEQSLVARPRFSLNFVIAAAFVWIVYVVVCQDTVDQDCRMVPVFLLLGWDRRQTSPQPHGVDSVVDVPKMVPLAWTCGAGTMACFYKQLARNVFCVPRKAGRSCGKVANQALVGHCSRWVEPYSRTCEIAAGPVLLSVVSLRVEKKTTWMVKVTVARYHMLLPRVVSRR